MTCSVAVCRESFESLTDRWPALLAKRREPVFSDTIAWQQTWWEEFGDGSELLLLSLCDPDGALCLLAPLMVREGEVSFLGGTDLVDFHDFLCPGDLDARTLDSIFRTLADDRSIHTFRFLSIPETSATCHSIPEAARAAGWAVEVVQEDVAPRMVLPGTWDDYVAGLSKKNRHELRRKLRRLEGAGDVRFVELNAPGEVEGNIGAFLDLHRMSMPEKAEFMTPERERFFRRAAVRLAADGQTRLCFLELDGARVAASLSFRLGGVNYLYNSGYNPEQRHLAVGLLNHALNIKRCIETGVKVFDFMRGNEPYKYDLGGLDRRVFSIIARRPA